MYQTLGLLSKYIEKKKYQNQKTKNRAKCGNKQQYSNSLAL